MKRSAFAVVVMGAALFAIVHPPQRIGMVIGIKPDRVSAYEALHAASNPGVRDLLNKYHVHNCSHFIYKLDDGRYYLFDYYQYTGNDYKADMKKLSAEPRKKQWLSVTDPIQVPLPGEKSWSQMQEIYHNRQ